MGFAAVVVVAMAGMGPSNPVERGEQSFYVVERRGASVRSGSTVISYVQYGNSVRVVKADEEKVWLDDSAGREAWVDRKDVLPAVDAAAFFSNEIESSRSVDALFGRGLAYTDLNALELAVKDLNEVLEQQPQHAYCRMIRGYVQTRQQKFKEAVEDFSALIRTMPDYSRGYVHRGFAWQQQGNLEAAEADYDRAIAKDPNLAMAYTCRGTVYMRQKRYREAMEDFTKALKIEPKSGEALLGRASLRVRYGFHRGALEDLNAAERLAGGDVRVQNEKAWLMSTSPNRSVRDGRGAVLLAERACEQTKWKYLAYIDTLAAAHAESGDFEDAVRWQRMVVEQSSAQGRNGYLHRLRLFEEGKPVRQVMSGQDDEE